MSRKAWYWTLAFLTAILVLLLVWMALPSSRAPQEPSSPPQTGHAAMDHGQTAPMPENEPLRQYLAQQEAIMSTMMADMDAVVPSGNAAVDFLAGMVPHHVAAVAMAESYLDNGGTHDILSPLARDIIDAQTAEIEQMETMLDQLQASGAADAAQSDAYWSAYHTHMDHAMTHATAASLDAAFAEGMLMHHQMALDMANAILPNTDDEDVKALARSIVDTQTQEIARMQDVLDGLQTD